MKLEKYIQGKTQKYYVDCKIKVRNSKTVKKLAPNSCSVQPHAVCTLAGWTIYSELTVGNVEVLRYRDQMRCTMCVAKAF